MRGALGITRFEAVTDGDGMARFDRQRRGDAGRIERIAFEGHLPCGIEHGRERGLRGLTLQRTGEGLISGRKAGHCYGPSRRRLGSETAASGPFHGARDR